MTCNRIHVHIVSSEKGGEWRGSLYREGRGCERGMKRKTLKRIAQ